jgi:GNAT acetyltransferase-like protein
MLAEPKIQPSAAAPKIFVKHAEDLLRRADVLKPKVQPSETDAGMAVAKEVDPLHDLGWESLVRNHPAATVFHTKGWLEALQRTYGYEPIVLTSTLGKEPFNNGLVLCKVSSWATKRRLVSLPFSDHCQPLIDDQNLLIKILASLRRRTVEKRCAYVELRPRVAIDPEVESLCGLQVSDEYCLHVLDLRPPLDVLFKELHRSLKQKLNRAHREKLIIREGHTDALLQDFYRLMIMTRRRHGRPPQPFVWFRNLITCLGDRLTLRVAFKNKMPIASVLLLKHNKTIVYKYGCSEAAFHNLGGMGLLLWHTIQVAKEEGFEEFDLGRSDLDNVGLIKFKDHLGAKRTVPSYYKYAIHASVHGTPLNRWGTISGRIFSRLPCSALAMSGRVLYKHLG